MVGTKPVIRHIVDRLLEVGFDHILVITYYKADQVKKAAGDDSNIRFINAHKYFKTASYLKQISNLLEDPFMVVNGDTLTDLNYSEFIEFHLINKNIATVFTKKTAIHSGGTYIFDKVIFNYIKQGMDIPDLIQSLVDQNIPINLYMGARYWDVGTQEKLEKARKQYIRNK